MMQLLWWCIKIEFLSNCMFEELKKLEWVAWWCAGWVEGWHGYHYLCCVMRSRPPLDAMPNSMRSQSSSSLSWNSQSIDCIVCGCVCFVAVSMLKWMWLVFESPMGFKFCNIWLKKRNQHCDAMCCPFSITSKKNWKLIWVHWKKDSLSKEHENTINNAYRNQNAIQPGLPERRRRDTV